MNRADGEAAVGLVERQGGRSADAFGLDTRLTQLRRKRHGEAPGMRRRDQLFRVGADAVLKTRRERILGVLQNPAVSRNRAFSVLQAALPDR
jgi:hypothetical protein